MDTRAIAAETYQKMLEGAGSSPAEGTDGTAQEKAFIKRLVLTALRRHEFLKKTINAYSSKPLPQKLTSAHLLIILGAVEILYFSTPEYAVVSSYVDIAKRTCGKYAGGFVNALLRKICQNKETILKQSDIAFFPKTFRKILQADYSQKEINAIEKSAFGEPPLDLSVKDSPVEWADKLGGKLLPNGSVRLYAAGAVNALAGYGEGQWWVQDMASSLAVAALGNIAGKKVLDLCAAPGGKTAQLLNAGAIVTALDISSQRLKTMDANLQRLGLKTDETICSDAIEYLEKTDKQYDIILLDAPCSATGTLRRHPEIVHTRGIKDIMQSAAVQKKMLQAAAPHVACGGILLYAICSLSKTEGEKQISGFLASNPDFKIKSVDLTLIAGTQKEAIREMLTPEGFLRCLPSHLPQDGGLDGFFIAQLQRVK